MEVSKDFEEFFASLNKNSARYLVVGGYAFAVHARPRYTGDIDIFILAEPSNAARVLAAIKDFGFDTIELTEEDLLQQERVIQLGIFPIRIDIMTSIDGVKFEDAWTRKMVSRYGSQEVYFIS
jgi:hypothetical protein